MAQKLRRIRFPAFNLNLKSTEFQINQSLKPFDFETDRISHQLNFQSDESEITGFKPAESQTNCSHQLKIKTADSGTSLNLRSIEFQINWNKKQYNIYIYIYIKINWAWKPFTFKSDEPHFNCTWTSNKMKPTNPNADMQTSRQKQHLSCFLHTLVGRPYLTHRLNAIVPHSRGTFWLNTLSWNFCTTLLLDTLVGHSYLTLL